MNKKIIFKKCEKMEYTKLEIVNALYNAIDEFNKSREEHEHLIKSEMTPLLGGDESMNSLSLVDFIIIVEEKILEYFDKSIIIADDKAMSERNSPFINIDSLSKYLYKILNEH